VILSVAVHCTQVARNVVMVVLRWTLVYKPWRNAVASSSRLDGPLENPTSVGGGAVDGRQREGRWPS